MNRPIEQANDQIAWSLAACARIHKVTIREIARHMGITLKRVREIRDSKTVRAITAWDCVQAIKELAEKRVA